MDNKTKENITAVFDGVEAISNTKHVVGEPYHIGDATIIPFLETSVGAGFGEFKDDKSAGGMAVKVRPIACLVLQNGFTKLVNLTDTDPITKALDMIPELVNKITRKGPNRQEVNEAIEEIKDSYEDELS